MKLRLILVACVFISTFIHAQDITGIWRGYFNSGYGYFKQQYKYEVQINQLGNNASQKGVQGVTYSYHSTVFYGKATLQGIYDSKNKSITIKETQLVELKIADKSEPCLMTCYLDYRKEGKTEILEGTFTSINAKSKTDCGSGYVYLERVLESEFRKEDFLLKKPNTIPPPVAKSKPPVNTPLKDQQKTTQPKRTAPPVVKKSNPSPINKSKPATKDNSGTVLKNQPQKNQPTGEDSIIQLKPKAVTPVNPQVQKDLTQKKVAIPKLIKERENPLIKTIVTNSSDILIQLYDNGEIDGDTITVYDNNEIIAYRKGLTGKPITLSIKADLFNSHHEFVMVANNLGSIPPNTALMVITTGGKRYELFVSSDEKKNARVVIDYKMPGKESR
jgi:hypothetical protein